MKLDTGAGPAKDRKNTLSASLRNRLVFTVSLIFAVTTLVNYGISSRRSDTLNAEKTAEYLIYLKDNLEIPLWNMDRDWINSICRSFANNEAIGVLTVRDGKDRILFQKQGLPEPGIETRTAALHHREYLIGSIELGISGRISRRQNVKMLLINILTMVLVLAGIAVSTRLILNNILETPLNHLLQKIDQISKGIYEGAGPRFRHFETIAILEKFNEMSGKVKKREQSLIQANKHLASEILDRKEAETAHKKSRARYRQLVEDLTVGLFRSSAQIDGPFMMVNQALARMLGYNNKDELLQKSVVSIYKCPDMRARFLDILFRQGELQGFEHEFVKKDGTTMVGLTTCHVSWDKDGVPLYIDGIIEDITQRRHFERQTRQIQKMEALGTLAGGIAHDFNNILASIFGFTEVAKLRSASGRDMAEPLDEILNAGIRARSLIKQILTFSRQSEVKKVPISVTPIVKETIKFLRASLPAMIEIRFTLGRDVPEAGAPEIHDPVILGDPTQIHQILMNVCTNAAHAMENGGTLDITLDTVAVREDAIQDLAPGNYMCLRVRDTGHGILPRHMERIFEPFFTTRQRGQGTGMGLAVVHGIVTDMGGRIMVESEKGRETVFSIFIPGYTGDAGDPPRDTGTSGIGKGCILFVDDEKGFLDSGAEILAGQGYEVITAGGGDEALSVFRTRRQDIDLVVTDMVMPQLTGLDLAPHLKQIRPGVPVVLCTGFSVNIPKQTMEEAGICDIVTKPILARELTAAVEKNITG
ncbi:MAG: ATP-binding protein [Desulfobacter sp.]